MTTNTSTTKRKRHMAHPEHRYEIVFERRRPLARIVGRLLAKIKELGDRTGAVAGDAYASLARPVLARWERVEDLTVERRARRARTKKHGARHRLSARSPEAPQPPRQTS